MSRLNLYRIAAAATALIGACCALCAQPATVGAELSPFRLGALYRHEKANFAHSVSLGADITGPLLQRSPLIGFYADYSCTIPIVTKPLKETVFTFYAGPGIDFGVADDIKHPIGVFLGPMAELRTDFESRRQPIVFSFILKPTLAFHTYRNMENVGVNMGIYTHGLMNSLLPQFGISYRFDGRSVTPEEERAAPVRKQKLFTFGIEAEYIANFHVYSHFNYVTEEGFRVNTEDTKFRYNTNAQILAGVGLNLSKHFNLSLYSGYQGITMKQALIPLLLRPRIIFGQPGDNGRWMVFADCGPGFKASSKVNRVALISHLGSGYRFAVTEKTSLDILYSIHSTFWHPWPFDETIVDVRRNNEVLLGVNLGIAVIL